MKDLSLLFKISFKKDFIGFLFGLTEDDGSSVSSSVKIDNIGNDGVSMIVWTVKGKVFNSFGGSHSRILN